jgi:hypothetical protein
MMGMATVRSAAKTRMTQIADGLMIAVAVSLPWSTSVTSILLAIWLIALIPTLEWAQLRRELLTSAGGLPAALFLLGVLGMLWADVSWHERLGGMSSFVRLLAVPLLMVQFRRSDKGYQVLTGFLIACIVLLVASVIVFYWPNIHVRPPNHDGVPVKSYIVQSLEFTICAAVLFDLAITRARQRQWKISAAFLVLAFAFLGDIFFITTGRTALVIVPVLVLLYGFRHSGWKGVLIAGVIGFVVAVLVWISSPYTRERVMGIFSETKLYEEQNEATSSGIRINYWKQSIRFVKSAPLFGHGTGSISDQFRRAAAEKPSGTVFLAANPHNQTFAVGIQLGLLGIAVLWAMWISQLVVFWGPGALTWIVLVIVTSNIVGSLFNSFIFDFTEGWIYIIGFGVVAGMVRRQTSAAPDDKAQALAAAKR